MWRRPEHVDGTPHLQDESYEPLWSYLEEANVPFAIHPGLNGVVPVDELRRRFDDYFPPMHAAHFVTEQMLALTTFVAYGILERHPRLRVAFLESGAVWALSYLHRLDEHAEVFGFERAGLTMAPSDYFRRQCFVAVEELEPGLDVMLAAVSRSVVFASDYPHADGTFPGSTAPFLSTADPAAPTAAATPPSCSTTRSGSTASTGSERGGRVRRHLRAAGDARLRGPADPARRAHPHPRGGDPRVQLGEHPTVGARRRHRPRRAAPDQGADGRGVRVDRRASAPRAPTSSSTAWAGR